MTSTTRRSYGEALIARPDASFFSGQVAISTAPFDATAFGKVLSSFSVFGGRATGGGGTNVGRWVTPLLMTRPVGPGFVSTVVGVGTTRQAGEGINSRDFGLTSGSDLIDENVAFAWLRLGGGAVHYSETGGPLVWFSSAWTPFVSAPAPG